MVVEKFPELGETIIGNNFPQLQSGNGANQAVAAPRQGRDVISHVQMVLI